MKRKQLFKSRSVVRFIAFFALCSLFASFVVRKPKILIIGDSISIGYTPFVQQQFSNKAEVYHNPGNAQHTGKGLKNIEEWINQEDWDAIQFNWGLWDLCYRDANSKNQGKRDKINGSITYNLETYASNLDSIVTIIKEHSHAKLIFVTTTYVPEGEKGRFSEDAVRYNNAAKEVMKRHSIAINDIYQQSKEIHSKFGKREDDVHYTEQGYSKLGDLVYDFLQKEIEK